MTEFSAAIETDSFSHLMFAFETMSKLSSVQSPLFVNRSIHTVFFRHFCSDRIIHTFVIFVPSYISFIHTYLFL